MSGSRPQGSMGPAAGNLPVSAPAPVRPTFPPQIGMYRDIRNFHRCIFLITIYSNY